jgi:sulfur carrier protein
VKVLIRHQKREVQVQGARRVRDLLVELGINPESVLVIRGSALLTHDARVGDDDTVELRPVVSGGAAG